MTDIKLKPLADEYGNLKAQIAELETRKDDIKEIFEQAGVRSLEGDAFRCVGSDIPSSIGPDFEKIARKFATDKVIEHPANQKVTRTGYYRVSVYARTGVVS